MLRKILAPYLPEFFLKQLEEEGIKSLYPAQKEAIAKGVLCGESMVLATPTASGKTLVATLAIMRKLNEKRAKALYIVPLVALASEKYHYYRDFFKGHLKVAVSVGDLDSTDPWLKEYQLIIVTSEKLDSLLRHGAEWLDQVGLVITDEIHLLHDPGRGPTLEILLTLLRKRLKGAQFLGLSATINNSLQLSDWLRAKLVMSDFRPVTLYEGVCFDAQIKYANKKLLKLKAAGESGIVQDTIKKSKKQLLIFVATRRSSESLAGRLAGQVADYLDREQLNALNQLSRKVLHQLERPTRQCQRLAEALKNGVAFHHAGLLSGQKGLIEESFRAGLIKVICATPTLAMGVNLPAFRVVIRDIKRYYPGRGSLEIPVLEYKQFAGRAGRPQYDKFGEAILSAPSAESAKALLEKYIHGKPENIESKLAQNSALSIHTLALISGNICNSLAGLREFFALSFFAFQYQDIGLIAEKIQQTVNDLISWGFLRRDEDRLFATSLGRRIAQLYLLPLSGHLFIEALAQAEMLGLENLGILQILCAVAEMQPNLKVRPRDLDFLTEAINRSKEYLLQDLPLFWDEHYTDFLSSMKTALCFNDWINETGEDLLLENFQITPGELHSKLEIADWLIYGLTEIASLLDKKQFIPILKKLRIRLHYGVKEELLHLVALKEIGRVRGRRLFDAGIQDAGDLKNTEGKKLAQILGARVSVRVKEQLK